MPNHRKNNAIGPNTPKMAHGRRGQKDNLFVSTCPRNTGVRANTKIVDNAHNFAACREISQSSLNYVHIILEARRSSANPVLI